MKCPECGTDFVYLELLYRCVKELDYVQSAEHISQCASAEGKELIRLGMEHLGIADLSADKLEDAPKVNLAAARSARRDSQKRHQLG